MKKMMLVVFAFSLAILGQAQNLTKEASAKKQAAAQKYYRNAQKMLISQNKRSETVKNAILLLHKAAELGHADAQTKLGIMYSTGIDAPINIPSAVTWLKKAAASNHPEGLNQLARFYHKGIGVPRDLGQAIVLWKRGAKLGNAHAQMSLALAYSLGDGTNKNYAHAYAWAYVASKNGANHADELKNVVGSQILDKKELDEAQKLADEWVQLYR